MYITGQATRPASFDIANTSFQLNQTANRPNALASVNLVDMKEPPIASKYLMGGDTSSGITPLPLSAPAQVGDRYQLTKHTGQLLKAYPQCIASNQYYFLIASQDGRHRVVPNELHDMSHFETHKIYSKASNYFSAYFDAPEHYGPQFERYGVSFLTAGFHFDEKSSKLAFKIPLQLNGPWKGVKSISNKYDIFPLGNNRWMIGQPTLRTCSFACEEMLLTDGKPAPLARQQIENRLDSLQRSDGRTSKEVLESINARLQPGEKPFKILNGSGTAYFEELKLAKLFENIDGPAYFGTNGHARIIDGFVPEDAIPGSVNVEYYASVRDPLTSNCVLTVGLDIFRHCGEPLMAINGGTGDWSLIYRSKTD